MFGYERRKVRLLAEPPRKRLRAGTVVWTGLFLFFALVAVTVSFESAMHFSGVPLDGPFQLYDALRRIHAGFHPGIDFQFFHGLGLPYLYYPFYRLFGGGLAGSEVARQIITTAFFPLVAVIFFRSFAGPGPRIWCLSAAAMAAAFSLRLTAVLFPINGMLGVRSGIPIFVVVALALSATRRSRTLIGGGLLGLSLLMATEQGMAMTAAFILVSLFALIRSPARRDDALELAGSLGVAVVVLVGGLLLIGGPSGMRGALRYNFSLVPKEQYWFFGAPPNTFVPSWSQGVQMLLATPPIAFALVLGLVAAVLYVVRLWRRTEDRDASRRTFALATLAVYAPLSAASLLGVFTPAYAQPCWRVVLLLALLELNAAADAFDLRAKHGGYVGVSRILGAFTLVLSAWTVATTPLIPVTIVVSVPHVIGTHARGQGFAMSGIWPDALREGQQAIDAHRQPNGKPPTLWSTYAGWLEAKNGLFNPSFDYVIHALGPENRREYLAKFRADAPTLVQTVLPTFTQYEGWVENNTWPLYDEILDHYRVYSMTPWSIFWERQTTAAPPPTLIQSMEVARGAASVQLEPIPATAPPIVLLEVEVDYETHNSLHVLPVVGGLPRFLIGLQGSYSEVPISLDPYATTKRFPILTGAGQQPTLLFQTFSLLPAATWRPLRIRVYRREIDDRNRGWVMMLYRSLVPNAPAG